MSCDHVQERISSILDQQLPAAEQENVLAHIGSCRDCSDALARQQAARDALRGLNSPAVPAALSVRLRVIASHERERQLSRVSFRVRLRRWNARLHLHIDNLMRPLAFPFAGGLVSSMMIFGLLVPTLALNSHAFADEARRRGLTTRPLLALAGDGKPTYRTGLVGWYLTRDGSLAVTTEGEDYTLASPVSLRARFFGVTLRPTDPPVQVGAGARDGESIALDVLLAMRLAAGDDWAIQGL